LHDSTERDDLCNVRRTTSCGLGCISTAAALSVWAKTDRDGSGHQSLVRHLEDAAAVAGVLWDTWLSESVRSTMSEGLPDGKEDGRTLLTWVAGLHDIGKATPGFAVKAMWAPGNEGLVSRMTDHGLACPPAVRGGPGLPPHCHLGHHLVTEWLTETFDAPPLAASALATPVGFHHGSPPSPLELQDFLGSPWTGRREPAWRSVQDELMVGVSRRTGALARLPEWVAHPPSEQAQILLSAAVVVADWLASDTLRFRRDDQRAVPERLADAGLGVALRGPWRAPPSAGDAAELLRVRFPRLGSHGIRPVQAAAVELAEAAETPGLMVIEAPMGSGKTEAALMAAEELARRFGSGGVFVALPTMATSDAMFARVREWTRHLGGADAPTIFLAHGKSRLNEDYQGVLAESRVRDINAEEGDKRHDTAVATSWLQGRRKGVLANLVVGTIDQVLLGALKTRHLALRHLALAGKVVVIDEVHAADVYMRSYLCRVLEWLAAYRVPVVLLSATLPPHQLAELTTAYARGRGRRPQPLNRGTGYPRITMQSDVLSQHDVPWSGTVTEVALEATPDDLDEVVQRAVEAARVGGCVVIVRNTVRRAQETYAAVRAVLGAERTTLIHSRFVAAHRALKERELLRRLGPPGLETQRPSGYVVVGTQVLEQSLDIDADLMISDHAPVDLLLQRMGRLHRHERGAGQSCRPEALRTARFVVVGAPETSRVPQLEPGSAAVYGAFSLLRSATVLAPHLAGAPVRLPTDIPRLVDAAYADNLTSPPGWEEEWEAADEAAYTESLRAKARAKTYRIGQPGHAESLVGWLDARASDAQGGDEVIAGHAQVRDSEDSLEVLVIWRDDTGEYRLLPGIGAHEGAPLGVPQLGPPQSRLALSVLGCSVRLPQQLTRGSRMDAVIQELELANDPFVAWRDSPWLSGQLILCLDERLQVTLGHTTLRYDSDLGLVAEAEGAVDV
jgi:CRISPR-associated endonuclease/helicase Cas3